MKRIKRFIQQIRTDIAWFDFLFCNDDELLERKRIAYETEAERLIEINRSFRNG